MTKDSKKLDGRTFVQTLAGCDTSEKVFDLLQSTMDKDTLRDRISHISEHPSVIHLNARVAEINAQKGLRTSREDCVVMAAHRYHQLNPDKKEPIKSFKLELNKDMTRREKENNSRIISQQLINRRVSGMEK